MGEAVRREALGGTQPETLGRTALLLASLGTGEVVGSACWCSPRSGLRSAGSPRSLRRRLAGPVLPVAPPADAASFQHATYECRLDRARSTVPSHKPRHRCPPTAGHRPRIGRRGRTESAGRPVQELPGHRHHRTGCLKWFLSG